MFARFVAEQDTLMKKGLRRLGTGHRRYILGRAGHPDEEGITTLNAGQLPTNRGPSRTP